MSLLPLVAGCAVILAIAYFTYGRLLSRLLGFDDSQPTPATRMRDDVDYVPLDRGTLLSQHFSAIAAAGPIVGPIAAGWMFGWAPALLWILFGSIFIGGVHDATALFASIRHRGRSIAEVVRENMSGAAYLLFLAFIWLALVYVVVAFTDITAGAFVGLIKLEDGQTVSGGGIATSSLLYLALPIAMGLLQRFAKLSTTLATIIFLPLVGLSIWLGQQMPLSLETLGSMNEVQAHRVRNMLLLLYCLVASITPMWLLLQPRGHLGGWFLFLTLIGGGLGLIFSTRTIQYPAFQGWTGVGGQPLYPLLFITVACGACSGFHAMVASGTTAKQVCRESHVRSIGYGAMLLEALVAILSLTCVMILPATAPELVGGPKPNVLYARGIGEFLNVVGVPIAFAVSFALMAFTTFVYDTLDVCTRLGRYVIQELLGWHTAAGRVFATAVTVGVPAYFLWQQPLDAAGKIIPTWRVYWNLFGASNQLLAALTLLGVTIWLWRTRRALWVLFVTGLPAVFMSAVSLTELVRTVRSGMAKVVAAEPATWIPRDPVTVVAIVLIGLASLMIAEAIRVVATMGRGGVRAAIAR